MAGTWAIRIRRLTAEDVPAVLAAAALFDRPPQEGATRRYLADDRNVFLLASAGRAPVGFLRGTELRQLDSARPQMFLYEVGVAESHRRQGIGTRLVNELLRYCEERGFEEVFVFTGDPANLAAERLYRSTGAVTETAGDRMFVYRLGAPSSG
jgi:ribosomal protein S18 acetylase RimI-like enzyme